jgi:hypothetical protein
MVRYWWDWGNPGNLGTFTYLLSQRDGRDAAVVGEYTDALRSSAESATTLSEQHAYGRAIPGYAWGSNGSVARAVMNLMLAYRFFGDLRYLDASVRQIDHLFGRNVYARSQVTQVGDKPPLNPHHRPSIASGHTFPGLLVGGAQPNARSWVDSSDNYTTNEVAINWNAALIYALAAFNSQTDRGLVDAGTGGPEGAAADSGSDASTIEQDAFGTPPVESDVSVTAHDAGTSDEQSDEAAPSEGDEAADTAPPVEPE